mgnify:CR=1 FL=1
MRQQAAILELAFRGRCLKSEIRSTKSETISNDLNSNAQNRGVTMSLF